MHYALVSLLRNIVAGLRLALFMRVDRQAFRIDVSQLLLLFVFSAAIDIVGDWFRTGPERVFSLYGAGTELYSAALLLLASALLGLIFRQRALTLAIPVIALASVTLPQAINFLPPLFVADALPLAMGTALGGQLLLLWMVAVLVRCVAVALAPPTPRVWLRAICGGLLLAAPIWISGSFAPNDPWWRDADEIVAPDGMSAGSEAVLATQAFLLDRALSDLADERPGTSDLYFVGFAPYGREDVFRKDIEAAQRVMDERWGTPGRSVLLSNNPQTLLTTPFATITNLRETLNEIGAAIDTEDDVVMVYLTSHGTRNFHLSADLPPLSLVELSPPGLRQLFDDAGIKWRIIVVGACYSGGFIEPLKDDRTLIITASRADRTSFGCGRAAPPPTSARHSSRRAWPPAPRSRPPSMWPRPASLNANAIRACHRPRSRNGGSAPRWRTSCPGCAAAVPRAA